MSRTRSSISSPLKALLAALVLVSLGACGFRPLYGGRGTDNAAYNLAGVSVAQIADREGQVLRNYLLDLLTPRGEPKVPRYEVLATVQINRADLGVRRTAFATRANLNVTVRYQLVDLQSKAQILSSNLLSVASFNILDSDYATEVAEEDARNRALRQIAEQMRAQISVRLKEPIEGAPNYYPDQGR